MANHFPRFVSWRFFLFFKAQPQDSHALSATFVAFTSGNPASPRAVDEQSSPLELFFTRNTENTRKLLCFLCVFSAFRVIFYQTFIFAQLLRLLVPLEEEWWLI